MEVIEKKHHFRNGGMFFGIIGILAGILLLAMNTGWIARDWPRIIFSWPSIIILFGLLGVFKGRTLLWPLYQILLGLFFLLPRIATNFPERWNGFPQNFTADYWPVLIILAGIFLILQKFIYPAKQHFTSFDKTKIYEKYANQSVMGSGFSKNSIFGGGEHIILDPEFSGGELNAIFGGLTLDLRRTSIPVGDTKLEINAVFGGINLYIPGDWYVETHIDNVFGGFEDKRFIQDPIDKSRRLIITGACVFGGGEIMS